MSEAGRTVALIGGGRWGRVHASNLSRLLTSRDRVLWVSRHNQESQCILVEQLPPDCPAFELLASAEEAFEARPSAALIVTKPETHFAEAALCLRWGVHVFVEKPLAFRAEEAQALVGMAAKTDLVLAVGLHLLSASYLRHFKSQIAGRRIRLLSIRWFDPTHEIRYGESKKADGSTPLGHDIYPHIWSLVKVLTDCSEQRVIAASSAIDGSISFETKAGQVVVEAKCDRRALTRQRTIEVVFEDGGTAALDFTQEPGVARLNRAILSADPAWGASLRPVMAEVSGFLKQIDLLDRDWPHLAANCLDSVVGAEALLAKLASS